MHPPPCTLAHEVLPSTASGPLPTACPTGRLRPSTRRDMRSKASPQGSSTTPPASCTMMVPAAQSQHLHRHRGCDVAAARGRQQYHVAASQPATQYTVMHSQTQPFGSGTRGAGQIGSMQRGAAPDSCLAEPSLRQGRKYLSLAIALDSTLRSAASSQHHAGKLPSARKGDGRALTRQSRSRTWRPAGRRPRCTCPGRRIPSTAWSAWPLLRTAMRHAR